MYAEKTINGFLLHLLCAGVIAQFIEYIKNPGDEQAEDKEDIVMPDVPKELLNSRDSAASIIKDITHALKNIIEKITSSINKSITAIKGKKESKDESKIKGSLYTQKQDYSPAKERRPRQKDRRDQSPPHGKRQESKHLNIFIN